ncbi:unnamed protein product, partial [Vitis vinifera]|uniref:Uncharacterized protein n=1 Tax=Vitis vinifera TaxID=29760 RepID=D7TF92_VITVI
MHGSKNALLVTLNFNFNTQGTFGFSKAFSPISVDEDKLPQKQLAVLIELVSKSPKELTIKLVLKTVYFPKIASFL